MPVNILSHASPFRLCWWWLIPLHSLVCPPPPESSFPSPLPLPPFQVINNDRPLILKKKSKRLITVLRDILCDNTAVWSYEWNCEEKCPDSFTVYYDQGDKPKNILLFLVFFNIHVFSFMVKKKSLMMLKIHLKKWTVLTLMALTIVPVKVTMLDPFSHARTWMRA